MMGQARRDAGALTPSGLESSSGTFPSTCAPPAWPAFFPLRSTSCRCRVRAVRDSFATAGDVRPPTSWLGGPTAALWSLPARPWHPLPARRRLTSQRSLTLIEAMLDGPEGRKRGRSATVLSGAWRAPTLPTVSRLVSDGKFAHPGRPRSPIPLRSTMSYQALARKYRPETFDQVVGQAHVTGHPARGPAQGQAQPRLPLLRPPRLRQDHRGPAAGQGHQLPGRTADGDPCGECETCLAIARGNYLDVLEIDAASNTGVDNIRELRDMAQYSPSEGTSRVFIIDEVHMLSKGAFNALLKILEEPPARVFFFFATTEPNKIPRTILSRCQRFDFRLLSRDELGGRLAGDRRGRGGRSWTPAACACWCPWPRAACATA